MVPDRSRIHERSRKVTVISVPLDPRPFQYRDGSLHCDETSLRELAAEYGTPLYVYSEQHILSRFALFQTAFAAIPHTICYALKANSSLALIKLLAAQGAGFDIVSGGELARVQKAAEAALPRTIFAGVGKQVSEIDAALRAGILLFNVESASELDLLAARADLMEIPARFALRVNPDVFAETHPYISTGLSAHKFGVDINSARTLYRKAAGSKWLVATGVSVHIGSQVRRADPFGAALKRVATLVHELQDDGIALTYVDAGGGLGIEYTDAFFDPEEDVRAYADQIIRSIGNLGLHLLLEPGRFLVSQAGALLTRVLTVKKNGAKTFVVTDAGMNDLIRPALYQAYHKVVPVREDASSDAPMPVDIVGPVCESGDFLARDRIMPIAKSGDLLAVLDAGAYGMSLASNYNTRPRPAEILVDGSAHRLIRRRETFGDLFFTESM